MNPALRLQSQGNDHSTIVLLASSDNTADVGAQIARAFDANWPDCPFDRFVLLSTDEGRWDIPGWRRVVAGRSDGWRAELVSGIGKIDPSIRHIILVLDDFLLLRRVDTAALAAIVARAVDDRLGYVRLKPVDRSWAVARWRRLRRSGLERLKSGEPYPASLQIAIWRRDHLLRMLALPGSIWEFEHQLLPDEPHYAVMGPPPIRYRHVVERGRWLGNAPRLFAKVGQPFDRGARPLWDRRYMLRSSVGQLRFALFGYVPMRLKAAAGRITSRRR